jgi:hypothetical protein
MGDAEVGSGVQFIMRCQQLAVIADLVHDCMVAEAVLRQQLALATER